MNLSSHILKAQGWCREHWIPYLHGCVWDRECRSFLAPMRIALMFGRFMWWVDLPGYYMDWNGDVDDDGVMVRRRSWHRLYFGS